MSYQTLNFENQSRVLKPQADCEHSNSILQKPVHLCKTETNDEVWLGSSFFCSAFILVSMVVYSKAI